MADSKFKVRAIVMRKERIYSVTLRTSRESFYNFAIKTVLKHSEGTIIDAKLKLDGHGDRSFKKALNTYLRRELNTPGKRIFKDLDFVDSHKNVLIQLADMIAGAIHRSYYEDKNDKDIYKGIITGKIEDEWDFGY